MVIATSTITIISNTISLLLFLPLGVVVGGLTERLATRNVGITPSNLWNTAVKLTVASWLWTRFICIHPQSDGLERVCILPSAVPLLYYSNRSLIQETAEPLLYEKCTVKQGIEIIIVTILKCAVLYISTRFGTALQPVGLTGGIACGKSTVSKLLKVASASNKKDAFAIVDVDAIAHDILVPGKLKAEDCAYHKVLSTFKGDDILEKPEDKNKSGNLELLAPIDRRKLGDIIFSDNIKRRKLNAITHPLISKVMIKQIIGENFMPTSNATSTVAVDIPLLFEVGLKMKLLFAIKVVVACTPEVQLKRLMERNPDLSKEQCQKRIESQIPVSEKVKMADIVIWNDGTIADLIREIENAREEIITRKHGFMAISISTMLAFACFLTTAACVFDVIRI